jgi:hypothetical protein
MNQFFVGMQHPNYSWPFKQVFISVNTLTRRQGNFRVNDWLMDSGAFTQISRFGSFRMTSDEYLEQIYRWSCCGNLLGAIAQDWMCEPFILAKTGKSIEEHQDLTLQSYNELSDWSDIYIMPVLQGYQPADYAKHVRMYGNYLKPGQWVGVGSVCRRNGNPDAIEDILLAIKSERSDLQLHGFGLKRTALLRPSIRKLLYSSDSMAWSLASRKQTGDAHEPRAALKYAAEIESLIQAPSFIQNQLFAWWS